MTWLLVAVLEISAATAIGFVLGRVWQTRHDSEERRDLISVLHRIEAKCSEAAGAIEKI